MHQFASGSSIVTLTRHPSGGNSSGNGSNTTTTLAFADADGNIVTSVVDGVVTSSTDGSGVTIVTTDSLGGHFLTGADAVTKIEIDDDVSEQMEIMAASTSKLGKKGIGGVVPEGEKKVCLWPTGNGTTCGKTFTKFDSLKRHLAENHKGVRPFACSLCDKTYGRRDYLQRHLKSHNANYAVNLQSASNISASQVVQKVHHSPKNTIILQQGHGGTLQVVSTGTSSGSSNNSSISHNSGPPSLPFLSLTNALPQAHKPLGSKICRWVNNDGTVCGKAFSKLDSLRRHVNELHKGVRPFGCHLCDKNYGRRDYLDRHIKTHDPDNQKKRLEGGIDWSNSGILVSEDGEYKQSGHLRFFESPVKTVPLKSNLPKIDVRRTQMLFQLAFPNFFSSASSQLMGLDWLVCKSRIEVHGGLLVLNKESNAISFLFYCILMFLICKTSLECNCDKSCKT